MTISAARLGVLTQVVFAVLIGGVSLVAGFGYAEPGFLARPLVLVALYSLIGVVGWLGVARGRPGVLLGAAAAGGVGSLIAFSGVTLIFLVPASLMAAGALVMLARQGVRGIRDLAVGAARGVLVLTLLIGTGAAALLLTDSACWISHMTASGPWIEVLPYSSGPMTLAGDATSGGCSTGLISLRGVGLGALLAAGSIVLAARRRAPVAAGSY